MAKTKKNNHSGKLVVPEPKPKESECTHCACFTERLNSECCYCRKIEIPYFGIKQDDLIKLFQNLLHRVHDLEHEVKSLKADREKISQSLREYQDDLIEL